MGFGGAQADLWIRWELLGDELVLPGRSSRACRCVVAPPGVPQANLDPADQSPSLTGCNGKHATSNPFELQLM
ncbi:hypothetical protein CRG98_049520, partial [Punica granatum]